MKWFGARYKFSDKSPTVGGVLASLMGLASLGLLIYGVHRSFISGGHAGMTVGGIGLLSLLMAVLGTVFGFMSFKEEDKFYTLSVIGTILCGMEVIFMIMLILTGI